MIWLLLWAGATIGWIAAGCLTDRAARWFGPRTPMGYDDRGRLVAYNPALHATTEHRLMLAQVRAWAPGPEWSEAT